MTTRSRALLFSLASACFLSQTASCFGFARDCSAAERDPIKADELFREGIELLKKDDWQTACPKFQESLALDPSVGAAINIARCDERSGKTLTALQSFQKARGLNRNANGEVLNSQSDQFISEAISRLETRAPKMVVVVTNPAPGMMVLRNGEPFNSLGRELQVDPGSFEFIVTAPGHRRVQVMIDVIDGKTAQIKVALEPLQVGDGRPYRNSIERRPAKTDESGFRGQAIAGFAIGGLGGASLIASAITGGIALSESGSMDDSCTAPPGCSGQTYQDAVAAYDLSQALALGSTISMFVGVALVGTGLVMVLTEPSNTSKELTLMPAVTPGFAGVFFTGEL